MKHRPDRIVVHMHKLILEFECEYALLRAEQKVQSDEPVAEGQLGVMQDCYNLEFEAMMTVLALEALLFELPSIFSAATYRTYHTLLDADFLPFALAVLFVRILAHIINKFHTLPVVFFRSKCTSQI